MLTRQRGKWESASHKTTGEPAELASEQLTVTFVNHSTFLIQTGRTNILLDPIFGERASPFTFAGPKRQTKPGVLFEDLPSIHVVLLSHNHYDHLDITTVRRLAEIHSPTFIVPLGVGKFLNQNGIDKIVELDWWQLSGEISGVPDSIKVQSVPAQHFSGRGLLDRDKTLWCGFVILTPRGRIYFAGDTGYHQELFTSIGERCGPMDISILPIGAYKPRWFMSPIHCSPSEAVRIHLDVRSRYSIASHFGTFPLADDSKSDPVNHLNIALKEQNAPPHSFIALREGDHFSLP